MFNVILKELRIEKDLNQAEVASCLNISRANVGHLETGRIEPSLSLLLLIADLFNVSVDYLLGRTSDINLIEEYQPKKISSKSIKFLELFTKLPTDLQNRTIGYMQALIENKSDSQV